MPSHVPADCFRMYDIRGNVGEGGITPDLAYALGLAIGTVAFDLGESEMIMGRDGRLSGAELAEALSQGLRDTGMDVIYIGQVPTPLVYFATYRLTTRSGVMVTASHNPGNHNGFKIVLAGVTLQSDGIQELLQHIVQKKFIRCAQRGRQVTEYVFDDYLKYVTEQIRLARPLRIVVDAGNGASSDMAPKVYRALGCEVIPLYCEMDGRFPNHHPDPSVPENLKDLIARVQEERADLGLAFDGDGDRVGVVTSTGEIIWPDRQMILYAMDALRRRPHAEVIFDVKCSRHLPEAIASHGGKPVMWRTGHSLIKAKLFESGAVLAGEMSGHIFFRDEWFGFDDGIYVGARLLQILAADSRTPQAVFDSIPNSVSTPELKVPLEEARKFDFVTQLCAKTDWGKDATLVTIDGVRVEYPDGWGLVRASNTSPCLTVRFEADSEAAMQRIQTIFRAVLQKADKYLQLPF
ncbi:MAG: phosphoglucomutase [Gammaproteobacteria bacterium RIFCSPHIGHO2_12_FULL_45_9]|nr:MAG: phosphoglucomutase [Gammaproteobacteria bacterium RIFCSPHIGHO2_12_FULL_45_9]